MEEIIYNTLQKYFNSLSVFGYKNYKSIEKLIALVAIDDLVSKDFRGHICLDEYQYIERALECLLGSDCIIPKIDLSNMACLNKLHLGDISEMEYRLKMTEANKLRTDMTILQENLSKAFLILAENSTLQSNTINDLKNNLALCCQITNANLTRIGDKLVDMNSILGIKLTELAHNGGSTPAPQPTIEQVDSFVDGSNGVINPNQTFYANFSKDGGSIPYSSIVPSGKLYKVSYKKINGVPEDSSLWVKTELDYVIDIPADAWYRSENQTLVAPANPDKSVRTSNTYINAGVAKFPLVVSQDAKVEQVLEEVSYISNIDGDRITLPTSLSYNFKKEGGKVEAHEIIPDGAYYRTTYTIVDGVTPPKEDWDIRPIGPVISTSGSGFVTAKLDYFEASANTGANQREDSGNIRIESTDIPVKFTQDGSGFSPTYTFSASPSVISADSKGKEQKITVTSTKTSASGGMQPVSYSVKSLPAWITKTSNTDFTITRNTGEARTGAIVYLQAESNKEITISVTQAAVGKETQVFDVKPLNITSTNEGKTETITVTSYVERDGVKENKLYSVEASTIPNWVEVTGVPTTAKELTTFSIKVLKNTTHSIRNAKLKVVQRDTTIFKEISITQNAAEDTVIFEANPTTVSASPEGGKYTVNVTSTKNGEKVDWLIENKAELDKLDWISYSGENSNQLTLDITSNS